MDEQSRKRNLRMSKASDQWAKAWKSLSSLAVHDWILRMAATRHAELKRTVSRCLDKYVAGDKDHKASATLEAYITAMSHAIHDIRDSDCCHACGMKSVVLLHSSDGYRVCGRCATGME